MEPNKAIRNSIRRQNEKRVKRTFATGSQARPRANNPAPSRSSGT